MAEILNKIREPLPSSLCKKGGISLSNVRSTRFIYFMAYAFELSFFCARGQFLSIGTDFFGVSGWTIVKAVHGIASLVFMLLWSKRFKKLVNIAVIIMVVGYIPFLLLPVGTLRTVFALLLYIGLGGAVTSCRCGFAFAANNAERFVSMLINFFSCAIIRYVRSLGADGFFVTYILPSLLLVGMCVCLMLFKEDDFEVREEADKKCEKGLLWAFALFTLYFGVDSYNASLVTGKNNPDFLLFFIGMVIAGAILFIAIAKFKLNTWHIWNVFFIAAFCMGLFAYFAPQLKTEKPEYFSAGLSMIGWPLCMFTMGCAMRRFASYKLLKKITFIFVIVSPIVTLSAGLIESLAPDYLPIAAMLFVLIFGVAFLMLSPFSYNSLFSSEWLPDMFNDDMTVLKEKVDEKDRFEDYQLTPRQKEIAVMLLSAKTRRQIAGELKISESTVKMHTGELYKRLGIGSRAQLFRMFGVEEETTED